MIIYEELEQGSAEWLEARLGIVTASRMEALMVKGKSDSGLGAGAITLMHELIAERITGEVAESQDTFAMEEGRALEPIVRGMYEERFLKDKCDMVGLIKDHGCGYSPDGLCAENGLLEIKTKTPKAQIGILLDAEVPKEHYAQLQAGLWISARDWIDFVSYSRCGKLQLFITRVYRDEEYIKRMASQVAIFYEVLRQKIEKLNSF